MVNLKKSQGNSQFPAIDTKEMHMLIECMTICKACAKKCTEEGQTRVALLCGDCCEICNLAIKFKSCHSEFAQQALDLCSQICRQCAVECQSLDNAACQECAEACRRCSEICAPALSSR